MPAIRKTPSGSLGLSGWETAQREAGGACPPRARRALRSRQRARRLPSERRAVPAPPAGGGTPRAKPDGYHSLLGPSQSRLDLLDKLPSSHEILASNIRVDGSCFLELFAGEAILTVAFMMNNVPGI